MVENILEDRRFSVGTAFSRVELLIGRKIDKEERDLLLNHFPGGGKFAGSKFNMITTTLCARVDGLHKRMGWGDFSFEIFCICGFYFAKIAYEAWEKLNRQEMAINSGSVTFIDDKCRQKKLEILRDGKNYLESFTSELQKSLKPFAGQYQEILLCLACMPGAKALYPIHSAWRDNTVNLLKQDKSNEAYSQLQQDLAEALASRGIENNNGLSPKELLIRGGYFPAGF